MSFLPHREHSNGENNCSTGIPGLDNILSGGVQRHRFHLVQGAPGSGKTTIGLHFLLEGIRQGEKGLFVTLSETVQELEEVARSHGWSLDGLEIFDLSAVTEKVVSEAQSTLFHPSEVELTKFVETLLAEVKRLQPARIVFDSLSEMRLLAQSPMRYRRQLLSLKQFFGAQKCTVVMLDDGLGRNGDGEVRSIAHSCLQLEQTSLEYGSNRRQLCAVKVRGRNFRSGRHDFVIRQGGVTVYPRLVAAEHRHGESPGVISSGHAALDTLLGGGLNRGTSCLLLGPPGTGKSSLGAQLAVASAERGEPVALYLFDEKQQTFVERAEALGGHWNKHAAKGLLEATQLDPVEISPGEFAHRIREAVERRGVRMVVIDSLNGYLNAMPGERALLAQLHELLIYLAQQGVVTVMVLAQNGVVGTMVSPIDVTYIADTVLLLRYFEFDGAVKQAISVLKKRSGPHERTIREFRVGSEGLQVGEPLTDFHGVLTGIPTYDGNAQSVMPAARGESGN